MTWTTPSYTTVTCGMEINMYAPADDDQPLFIKPAAATPANDDRKDARD